MKLKSLFLLLITLLTLSACKSTPDTTTDAPTTESPLSSLPGAENFSPEQVTKNLATLNKYKDWFLQAFSSPTGQITSEEVREIFSPQTLPDDQVSALTEVLQQSLPVLAPVTVKDVVEKTASSLVLQILPAKNDSNPEPKPLNLTLALDPNDLEKLQTLALTPAE